jgi:hypothetical protein
VSPGAQPLDPGPRAPGADAQGTGARSPAYERLVRRLSSRAALWVGGAWGLAEASLFFIVPDVWLGFVALYAPRRAPVTLLAIVAGAVVGAALLYVATLVVGDGLSGLIVGLPGIAPADLSQARSELADQGAIAFLNGPLQGLPVKVYIHAAALHGIDLLSVTVAVVLNRLERIVLFGLVMATVGFVARPAIARWPRACAILYGLTWVIFYAGFVLAPGT